jgi:thioredoxin reductase
VTVIGGGQSALETAALLHEMGALVRVLVRKPEVRFHLPPPGPRRSLAARLRAPTAGLGAGWLCWLLEHGPIGIHLLPAATRVRLVRQILGPCGAWWLKGRVVGRFEVMTNCTILRATAEGDSVRVGLRQEGHQERDVRTNHIIAGTGYHVDLRRLRFLSPALLTQVRELDGSPVLSRYFESSVPGLYFAGLAAAYSFGPLLRFVLGVHFAAPTIAERAARMLERGGRFTEQPVTPIADGA